MVILSFYETTYDGMFKIQVEQEGQKNTFFVRKEYLPDIDFEKIQTGSEYNDEETGIFLDAGLTCVVELKAIDYLARAEQCRFGLTRKLQEKEFDKKYINKALNYLESINYLSDQRFARAWLNTRKINHFEGKTRLLAELQSRGINKEIANFAINEFFTENDENEICLKAYERFVKKGKQDEKLTSAMLQAGFSYKSIKIAEEQMKEK